MQSFVYDYPVKNYFGEGAKVAREAVADTAVLTAGCAKKLERDEIFQILAECR